MLESPSRWQKTRMGMHGVAQCAPIPRPGVPGFAPPSLGGCHRRQSAVSGHATARVPARGYRSSGTPPSFHPGCGIFRVAPTFPCPRSIPMSQRADFMKQSPDLTKKLVELETLLAKTTIEEQIQDLVKIRASQLNGCAFCLDMHIKQATIRGERPLRIFNLPAWRESPLFSPRERAALA